MNIIYSRLFELSILHDYFQDGFAKGIHLAPTEETQWLLSKGRMISRETPTGLVVLYKAEDDLTTPLVPLTSPINFYFFIHLQSGPNFFGITDLSEGSRKLKNQEIVSFSNDPSSASNDSASPETISLSIWDGIIAKHTSQRVTLNPTPSKVLLRVLDPVGNSISSGLDPNGNPLPVDMELTPDDQDDFSFEINLSGKSEGNYTFLLRDEGDTTDLWKKEYFLTENVFGPRALGVVKISYASAPNHLYGAKEFYALDFKRKSTKWLYYIVSQSNKVDVSSAQLAISDKSAPVTPPYALYAFDQIGAAPNTDIKINDSDTVLFKSQDPIPFFEVPKIKLELSRKPGNKVLISNMPNPSSSNIRKVDLGEEISEIYVYI